MLPHVIRYNAPEAGAQYAELLGQENDSGDAAESVASRFEELRDAAGLPTRLRPACPHAFAMRVSPIMHCRNWPKRPVGSGLWDSIRAQHCATTW
jgi:hypothetical protein